MSATQSKNFNLPWHQHDQYWIALYGKGVLPSTLADNLQKAGFSKQDDGGLGAQAPHNWKSLWDKLHALLVAQNADVEVAITPGTQHSTETARQSPAAIQSIAESLWLGDAVLEDRLMCYLQPVMGQRGKVMGYESFARVKGVDGNIIAGDRIIAASKALGIEYMIDRHLHVQAIKTFVSSEFDGFLFVNFFPGFIHRPAVYLEGLSETAKNFGVMAKHIVLDFTKSETPRDLAHLKSVCEYGRSRGYSIALDDISSEEAARKLVAEIRPDFLKIDMQLVRQADQPAKRETIAHIVELVHANGGMVIGEGVESEDIHQALKALGVDLFQGYLFSPPVPVEAALKRNTA